MNEKDRIRECNASEWLWLLLFTHQPIRGVFCECSAAKVTENPRAAVLNRIFCGLCASRSVLLDTARQGCEQ